MRAVWWGLAGLLLACSDPDPGLLTLRIVDERDGSQLPARVELLDESGAAWTAPQALPLRFECFAAPLPDFAAEYLSISDRVPSRADGADHFYLDGPGELELPSGRYRLRVFHGIEARVATREIEIVAGEKTEVEIPIQRFADMASEGWWSVDDHVHITRRDAQGSENIAAWMQAEDLRIVNLLQMGTVDQVGVTPQLGFGDAGTHRRGDTLLLAGQEHPRTHFLGHTITLGADALIDRRDTYIVYETTFAEALRQNGVPGYAHFGLGPARTGLSLDAPRGLAHFVEVLQFDFAWYQEWYDLLDLGLRIAPTAGTDFPCGLTYGVPGRERFYVKLDGPPERSSFVAGVRAGRTFVTNGPLLELRVGEAGIGDTLELEGPGTLGVSGRVRFDPERDDVESVELVVNGELRPLPLRPVEAGELRFATEVEVSESSWLALRVSGDKVGETLMPPAVEGLPIWFVDQLFDFREMTEQSERFYASRGRVRPSAAHTGAIFVTLPDARPSARARERATEALARLEALEEKLSDERIADQTLWDWFPYSDAVSEAHLRRNRPALLRAIAEARDRYGAILDAR